MVNFFAIGAMLTIVYIIPPESCNITLPNTDNIAD